MVDIRSSRPRFGYGILRGGNTSAASHSIPAGRWSNEVPEPMAGFRGPGGGSKWPRLFDHIHEVVCHGSVKLSDYLLGWMAHMVQHPDRQGEVAVVMRGGEGTGKGTLECIVAFARATHALGSRTQSIWLVTSTSIWKTVCICSRMRHFLPGQATRRRAEKSYNRTLSDH